MTSKKQRAKAQRDLYRVFIQKLRKTDKRYKLGRYTQPKRVITRPEELSGN